MQENDILERWLDTEAKRVAAKIRNHETLTLEETLLVILQVRKNQFERDKKRRESMESLRHAKQEELPE
uniref:Uncharacterized protein n=1 Tax=Candidatus Kentrum sp. FW TaxID=2126338 RepID=A0A450RTA8_9GAMM|nr:MAG: hypothetical protein BECKFW1821A_GA0114235_100191 [Candidatus Kentron sp. FW]